MTHTTPRRPRGEAARRRALANALAALPTRIRVLRTHLALTEAEMAEMAGLSLRAYRRLEAGKRVRIGLALTGRIASGAACSLDWLVTGAFPCFDIATRNDHRPLAVGGVPIPPRLSAVQ